MDRGTDPMDLEVENPRAGETSAAGGAALSSRNGTNSRLSDVFRVAVANLRASRGERLSLSSTSDYFPITPSFLRTARQPSFLSRTSNASQNESSDSAPADQNSRAQSENSASTQGRNSHFVRVPRIHTFNRDGNVDYVSNNETPNSPARYSAGTDERTASRSSSQHLSAEANFSHSDNAGENSSHGGIRYSGNSSHSDNASSCRPSEANSEDSSHSSSVESVRIRRENVFRNSEQSECSTSNSENVSRQSSGRQASPRSSTSLSVSLGNLGFAGSEAESSFDNVSESGAPQNESQTGEEPFLVRPLSGLPPENIGFNIRQSGSQAGSEDSDVIIPNVGIGAAQRGSGVRVRRRRLFHESHVSFSDESTLSSSQHNSPDDINNDINNLERSTAQLLSQDLSREHSSAQPITPSRHSPSLTNRGFQRFFCEPVSDQSHAQSSSDVQRARQRNLEDSLSSLSTSWERLSASFQQRSSSRTPGIRFFNF